MERRIALRGEYITLGQLLKLTGEISGGGEARGWLETNRAQVNGEPESRRGRKLRVGDQVTLHGGKTVYIVPMDGSSQP